MSAEEPSLLSELVDWTPPDYAAHFAQSGFDAADTVIDAYHNADHAIRTEFDTAVAALVNGVRAAAARLSAQYDAQQETTLILAETLAPLHDSLLRLSALIQR